MIDDFNPNPIQAAPATGSGIPATGMYIPSLEDLEDLKYRKHKKHRKPKTKKAAKKALRKIEKERDKLLYVNGRLSQENEMMKRTIFLAIAVSRRKFDTELAEDFLRMLPTTR